MERVKETKNKKNRYSELKAGVSCVWHDGAVAQRTAYRNSVFIRLLHLPNSSDNNNNNEKK